MKNTAATALLLAFSIGTPAFAAEPVKQGENADPPKLVASKDLDAVKETTTPKRRERARKLVSDKLSDAQIKEPVTLSVRKSWLDDHTYFSFSNAIVDPNANLASVPGHHGVWNSITGTFLTAPGRTYMIDCTVGGSKQLYVRVMSGEPANKVKPAKLVKDGDYDIDAGHLYFVVAPQGRRQVSFEMFNHHDGVDWALRRCEITPIES